MKRKCCCSGCKEPGTGGWIDFAVKDSYCRLWFCKEHFDAIYGEIEKLIEAEKKSGKLKKNQFYAVVPKHIREKVLIFEGE